MPERRSYWREYGRRLQAEHLRRIREASVPQHAWITKTITKTTQAQKCPVCKGRGVMPEEFYSQLPTLEDVACRSCDGKGIV